MKETLQLSNAHLMRIIRIGEDGSVVTTSLRNPRTGKEFMIAGQDSRALSNEFSFQWRGRWLHGHRPGASAQDFIVLRSSQRSERPGVQRLELFLATADGELQVQVHYEIYEGQPLVRKWLSITNDSDAPGRLGDVLWEDLAASPGHRSSLEIGHGIEPIRPESAFLPELSESLLILYDAQGQEALVAANEEPGISAAIETSGDLHPRLQVHLSNAFGGIQLAPNETFQTAAAALILADQRTLDQPLGAVLPDYIRTITNKPPASLRIAYCAPTVVTAEGKMLRLANNAHFAGVVGMTTVAIEGGGFRRAGGFNIDPEAMPGGLGHAAKLLDERQLELGVTVPLGALDPECAVAQEHPEWFCRDRDGETVFIEAQGERRQIACLASEYAECLISEIRQLHDRDGVKMIHLTGPAFHAPRSSLAPCHATWHMHHGPSDSALAIGRRVRHLLETISTACPELSIGVDHDVLGRTAGAEAGLLAACGFMRICSIPEIAGRRTHVEIRRHLYRHALRLPSERLTMSDLRLDGQNPVATLATALGAFPLFCGQAEHLAPGQLDWMRGMLDWFFALSHGIAFHERFYLLHGQDDPHSGFWDGYARLSRGGEGFLAVFRNGAAAPMMRFPIPGLDPSARYRVDSVLRDRALGIYAAADLADGFPFELSHEDGADIIEIRRVEM